MWNDDIDFPSVEEPEDDWVLPDSEVEWNEWWFLNTLTEKGLRHWKAYGGRESRVFLVEADAA